MGNQGSNLGWPPAGGGGGGSDPLEIAYAKSRRFRTSSEIILPAGALVIDILNVGLEDITIVQTGVTGVDKIAPGMRYNFVAQQNLVDGKYELSKQITATTVSLNYQEVMVIYPASSSVDLDNLEN